MALICIFIPLDSFGWLAFSERSVFGLGYLCARACVLNGKLWFWCFRMSGFPWSAFGFFFRVLILCLLLMEMICMDCLEIRSYWLGPVVGCLSIFFLEEMIYPQTFRAFIFLLSCL
uniref:Uncharacterized protein n=1 Tax=Rhizophora mucronata TaxID=61149 RepID=A0A2P2PIM2_RHIMU